jgi:type III secretion protein Q
MTLPRVSRAEAAASRSRHRPRAELPFTDGRHRMTMAETTDAGIGPDTICLTLHWGAHVLLVRCSRGAMRQALAAMEPTLDPTAIPAELFGLLVEAAFLPTIAAAERRLGCDIRIATVQPDAEPPAAGGLHLVLDDGERRWPVQVSSTAGGDGALAALLQAWPVAPRAMSRFPLQAALRLGTTPLSIAALRTLRPDDVVLFRTMAATGATLVLAETWMAPAERKDGGWRLSGAPRPAGSRDDKEWIMPQDSEPMEQGRAVGDPDEIPVRMTFDIGRIEIPLGDLRRLGVGAVVELDRDIDELVRISANGRPIGDGVLVDVEGRAGVRIVRLFDHG